MFGLAVLAAPASARTFSPAVNAHVDVDIPSRSAAPEEASRRSHASRDDRSFSPAVNARVSVNIPSRPATENAAIRPPRSDS